MNRSKLLLVCHGLAFMALLGQPRTQEMIVSRRDGSQVKGAVLRLAGSGREASLVMGVAGREVETSLAQVLAIHGRGPSPVGSAMVSLVGGDHLRGELQGGDAAGETFTVVTRSLGPVSVALDRLAWIRFGGGTDALVVPEGVSEDEALFRHARRGLDTILGAIDRFTARGVMFEWGESEDPGLFAYSSLAGLALRGGDGPPAPAIAQLVTRSGDRVAVELAGLNDAGFDFVLEGGRRIGVARSNIAAITFFGPDRRFLSELEPVRIEEKSSHLPGDDGALFPYRRDRTVTGGFLVAGGYGYGKGLGVHARSVLTYRVPQGFGRFWVRAVMDDEVLKLPVRAEAVITIKLDNEVVFGPSPLRSGKPSRLIGPLPVRPGGLLTLEADFGVGWFVGDRVDWLLPVFLK